ncbi:hypothetical protein Q5P01_011459 [Channa striata]|uniref:Ig-like domain-containing protein n=1 Tax=Channa striata TaxID=64152 RepID=A0AA88MTF2_CHASR|nr:hypothetical protein Q5P01_011459 [Channa striata]
MKTAVTDFVILGIISDIIGPGYENRISFDRTTGSLELRSLTLSDSGEYRVIITPDGGHQLTGSTRLEILAPAHNIVVTPSSTDMVEFNSSVRLSCSSSGTFLSFLWLNGSSEVTASDRVQLTDGNATLTIFNVTRYDQGPFRCHVSNALSNGTSEPVKLSISLQAAAKLSHRNTPVKKKQHEATFHQLNIQQNERNLYMKMIWCMKTQFSYCPLWRC